MAKYLDSYGLSYFWGKIKSWVKNYTHASYDQTTGRTTVVVDNITFDVSHKLPADYAPSTLENDALNPAANDSYDLAFSKIHKAIKDTERVTAEALTDLDSRVNELDELKAPKASPALTGTPTAPTAASGTNTTQIATTAFVQAAVNSGTGSVKVDGIKGSTINRYGVCSTAAGTAAKTVNITSGTFPTLDASATGTRITIKFTNANTASTPTLNVNSKGAKGIYYKGTQITTDPSVSSVLQGICDFIYDNANGWNLLENFDNTTGATNDTSKLFIIGAKTQKTAPVTYSQENAYIQDGKVYSNGKEVVNLSDTQTLTNKTLTSPALTGTPTAPTPTAGTNTTQVATTAFVNSAVSNNLVWRIIPSIDEMTANTSFMSGKTVYVKDDTTLAQSILSDVASKKIVILQDNGGNAYYMTSPSSSDFISFESFVYEADSSNIVRSTGVIIINPSSDIYSGFTIVCYNIDSYSTVKIDGLLSLKAPLASPAFTGTPTAPTATVGTNNTQVATTAFVTSAVNTAKGAVTAADDLLDGSHASDNTIKYAPYTSKGAGHLYSGTTDPTNTNRLNYDGAFYATNFNGKTLGQGNSSLTTSDTTKIPTSAEVAEFVANAQVGAAMFQGVIKSGTSITNLPSTGYKKGWYWIVGTAGTYAGQVCEVGDTIFCVKDYASGSAANSDFNVLQNNIETISTGEIDSIESWPASS